ncbi:hypothetical protein HY256_04205 [Candidatus Sumerlaeota bacterium]|nr:hypothetical protein [Candidatus Sumerlaeota bacterium]
MKMSLQNLKAAQLLAGHEDCVRSGISRAYYSAYWALTGRLAEYKPKLKFRGGRNNPPHEKLAAYVQEHYNKAGYSAKALESLVLAFEDLRYYRESADYRPHREFGRSDVEKTLLLARRVLKKVRVL